MNKIYRLIWSYIHNAYIAAPEIAKGQKKGGGRSALCSSIAIFALLNSHTLFAIDVNWAEKYPAYLFSETINYDQILETGSAFTIDGNITHKNHYVAGTTLNILGPMPTIATGKNGSGTTFLVSNGLNDSIGSDAGRITFIQATDSNGNTTNITSDNIGQFFYSSSTSKPQQDQELNVIVPGLEGAHSVIKTYDSTTFSSSSGMPVGNIPVGIYDPTSFQIYNNFNIVRVTSVGGKASINIGADTDSDIAISAPQNTISLLAKNSVLARAEATQTASSSVNWVSDNYINFSPAAVLSNDQESIQVTSSQYNDTITLPNYVEINSEIFLDPQQPNITFTINSAQDIATVNDFLLGQGDYSDKTAQIQLWLTGDVKLPDEYGGSVVTSAATAQNIYNDIIQGLLTTEQKNQVNITYHLWKDNSSHTNNATLATGNLNVIYATGHSASGEVTAQGSLAVDGASAIMRADNQATLTNNGNINLWRTYQSSPLGVGMLTTDATAINYGTINAGLFIEKDGTNQNQYNAGSTGMQGKGASTLNNLGIINVALTNNNTTNAVGIRAQNTTTAKNSGTVAVVGNSNNSTGRATGYGVSVSNSATFTNESTGNIYVGSTPITLTEGYTPESMVGGTQQSAGILTTSSNQVINEGNITLGENTRNAVGILISGASGSVINNGTINVLGKLVDGAAASNYGLSAIDTVTVTNNGLINVTGDNNIAINILAEKASATVNSSNSGVISVGEVGDSGGSDNNPYTYRNYAVFAEGLSSYQAIANIDSEINLYSAGAIGVHARGNATINVGTDALLTFNNGQQIGYYAYGQNAKIRLSQATLDDNGQTGSTLFLIDNGAIFNGDSGTSAGAYHLTVNGTGSTGVHANGFDDGSNETSNPNDDILTTLNTGTATITVNGDNAIGVKVSGGAVGTINDGGIILSHDNTTAVVVDGRNYSLDGQMGKADEARLTQVDSNIEISTSSSQSGIKGYDVSHLGEVTLSGKGINLNGHDNIGLYLHNGGTGINNAPINVSGTDNIGVYIQDKGTLTNNGDITVSGAVGSGNVGMKVQGSGANVTQLGKVTANGGLAAVQLIDDGASLTISGTDNYIKASGGADGIRMDAGASSLTASNTVIDISDSGSGINNNADTSNINLSSVIINADDGSAIRTAVTFTAEGTNNILNISGSGAGFAFEKADGSNTTGDLTIGKGYVINVTGDDGNGILAKTNGSVTSSADITMSNGSGSAIVATDAHSVTNNGNIQTSSDVHSSILANNAANFTNSGTINSTSTSNAEALIQINNYSGNRTITNTGTITANSQTSTVIDASGSGNNNILNYETLSAASDTAVAILSGSGNDRVTLLGGQTQGLINMGSGSDNFTWNSGTFSGAVDFTGNDGNDSVNIGNVDLSQTRHILSEGGTNNIFTLTNTNIWNGVSGSAFIGSLLTDDISKATNIGTGWSQLTVTGAQADIRVIDNLTLSGTQTISVLNGATLRTGDNTVASNQATISHYNVTTNDDSLVIFDGVSADQIYSGIISGSGQVERASGGTTTLLANNTWTGNTTIDVGGTLQLGNGGTTGAVSEVTNIIDNGLLAVYRQDNIRLNGAISGTGAFHQLGDGTTRLSGNNSYKSETWVKAGTLLVNGNQSAATGITNVASGATLGGYGTIGGDVIFASNTALTPGDNGAGTLTINGDLFLSSTTNSQFELGRAYTPGGTLNDLVNVGGDLTLDGDLNVTVSAGGLFLPGVYRLFNYNGTLTDNGLELASLPPGEPDIYYVQTTLPNQVNLVVDFPSDSHSLRYWDGPDNNGSHGVSGIEGNDRIDGGSGLWVATINDTSNNWTDKDGHGNAPWSQNDFAIFMGDSGTVTVSDIHGSVYTSGMQFVTDGYVLNSGENASGTSTTPLFMVKTTDDIPTVNYQSQGETVADGYFAIRVGAGGGGSDVTATINADLQQSDNSNDILKLLKYDPGRLILRGNNTYEGGTEIYDGTLNVANDNNLGLAGTSILITNNATLQIGENFTTDRLIFLSENGGGKFDLYGNTFTPTGVIGGDGQLTILDSSEGTDNSRLVLNTANAYKGSTTVIGKENTADVDVDVNITGAFGLADSEITVNRLARVNFNNSTSAESHKFMLDRGILNFNENASADSSTTQAKSGSVINLNDNAQGGQAQFTLASGASMNLHDASNAGSAKINNSGLVTFADSAQGENATITNNSGGLVDISAALDATTIGSLSGAGNVELGASTLYEGSLNLNDTISGIISGDGGSLNKIGSGTLTLTGDNTWTGTTSVQQGVMLVNGNQQAATGDVYVAAYATLGGAGTMGGKVTIADDGRIAAGADLDSVGVFTLGGLTLNQNSQLDYQFGKAYEAGGSLNDLININGDLKLDGQLNITQTPGGSFDVGIYRVINYTGTLTNNVMDIGTAPEAADDLYVQTSVANQVNLVNRTNTVLNFWDGTGGAGGQLKNNNQIDGGDGIWQNSAGNDNWTTDETNPSGAFNAPFSDGSFAVFSGEKGNVTVDNSLGEIRVSGMQFATDGYVINEGVITTNTAKTLIRVGDGTIAGTNYIATINSMITGTGGLDKADVGTLVLNGTNTYTGGTWVRAGTLQVSSDSNLGKAGTTLTLNGGTLRYGAAFDTDRPVVIDTDGGTIDTNGNNVSLLSIVTGEGILTKAGKGTLVLTLDNEHSGGTRIEEGSLQLGQGGHTGSVMGHIINNDTLQLNRANTLHIEGEISGTGQVWQQGSGTTIFSGDHCYTGLTLVESGTIQTNGQNRLSAASSHIVSANGLIDTQGHNQTVAGLVNQGRVSLIGGKVGSTITVKGNYVGLNGVLSIAAQQHSPGIADRLVIDSGTVTGVTRLDIDASQLGEQTEGDGIKVVEAINGATTTAQSTKDGFTLGTDQVSAGAFQYGLFAGNAEGQGEDWFLRTGYRPEVAAYSTLAATTRQADLAVLGTLHQRIGDEVAYSQNLSTGEDKRFWMRYISQTNKQSFSDVTRAKTKSHLNGIQVGIDLYSNPDWNVGVYTTALDVKTNISGASLSGYSSATKNSMSAVYLGGYATWNAENGFYVDNVLQYGYQHIDIKNKPDVTNSSPNGDSYLASVEIGKPFYFGNSRWSLEPQAQVIYQHNKFKDVALQDDAGTRTSVDADDVVVGRLGARLATELQTEYGQIKPYVRANLWQTLSNGKDSATFENTANRDTKTTVKVNQQYSSTEVAAGATWAFSNNMQVYTEVGRTYQNGGKDIKVENDFNGSIGIKMNF